jgi:hypothetical protein
VLEKRKRCSHKGTKTQRRKEIKVKKKAMTVFSSLCLCVFVRGLLLFLPCLREEISGLIVAAGGGCGWRWPQGRRGDEGTPTICVRGCWGSFLTPTVMIVALTPSHESRAMLRRPSQGREVIGIYGVVLD